MSLRVNYCAKTASLACLATLVLFLSACGNKDTPDGMFVAAKEAVLKDKPVAVWNALPTPYRNDINGMVHQFGAQIDAKNYDAFMNFARKVAVVLTDNKDRVLNSQSLGGIVSAAGGGDPSMHSPEAQSKYVEESYDLAMELLTAITESDLGSASGLQKVDLGSIISKYGGTIMKLVKNMIELSNDADAKMAKSVIEMMKEATFTVTNKTATEATVTVKPFLGTSSMKVIKVQDRWVPEQLAASFGMMMAEVKAGMPHQIQELNHDLAEAVTHIPEAEKLLESLKDAKTQEEFDKIMGKIFASGALGNSGGPGTSGP